MNRPGDWNCQYCSHLNFQRRDSCQRCREPRLGGITNLASGFASRPVSSSFTFNTGPDVRPGDWYCNLGNCGTHNFASRSSCFKCGVSKDESSPLAAAVATGFIDMSDGPRRSLFGFGSSSGGGSGTGRSSWKSGDWICSRSGCNEHNFASRSECFRCNAPKEPATNPPY
ncbi:hypothetical protein EUTSA_v10005026mg [Eutrema salsugineum]|uniref:RanBP2-type domain-containing protein n=1 Tax=Eutrema salsugineum TaxID=72664 RepID=V4KXG9_EUTSA|nr:uncharacterized RNA-binding protein C17H9.04c [Eutrema salsugineum]ESQ32088.1 hypothetical protein EUTSA_v10005026mg [Eutrema salsugineum]